MDGRQDQVVLVQQRDTGMIAGRIRRIQGEFGQEALARGIAPSDLFELNEISTPNLGVFVEAVEMRFIPKAGTLQDRRPLRVSKIADRLDESGPVIADAGRGGKGGKGLEWIGCLRHVIEDALRGSWTDARQQVQHAEAC